MKITWGAGCVVRNPEGQVLLIKRDEGRGWTIPGGAAEAGETPVQAAARETFEEAGIEVAVDGLVGVYSFGQTYDLMFVYTGHPLGSAPGSSPGEVPYRSFESADVRYFAPERIPARMLGVSRQRLFDALSSERGLCRYQPLSLWARLLLPGLLRVRKLRSRVRGRPEPPVIRHAVIGQGVLKGNGFAPLVVEAEPVPDQPLWETLCARAETITHERIEVSRLLDVQANGEVLMVRFALRVL